MIITAVAPINWDDHSNNREQYSHRTGQRKEVPRNARFSPPNPAPNSYIASLFLNFPVTSARRFGTRGRRGKCVCVGTHTSPQRSAQSQDLRWSRFLSHNASTTTPRERRPSSSFDRMSAGSKKEEHGVPRSQPNGTTTPQVFYSYRTFGINNTPLSRLLQGIEKPCIAIQASQVEWDASRPEWILQLVFKMNKKNPKYPDK